MQYVYAVEQEYSLSLPFGEDCKSLRDRGVARISILDDQYLAADADTLADIWIPFQGTP